MPAHRCLKDQKVRQLNDVERVDYGDATLMGCTIFIFAIDIDTF